MKFYYINLVIPSIFVPLQHFFLPSRDQGAKIHKEITLYLEHYFTCI